MTTGGTYTAATEKDYIVEITTGGDVGVAIFKWSDDGGATYTTGVTTSASPITLSNGVTVTFTTGSGTDFVVADQWTFKAFVPNGRGALLALNPNLEHRSASALVQLQYTVDFGQAVRPLVLVLHEHNFTGTSYIRLRANTSASWSSPPLNETITWRAKTIRHYVQTSAALYRYWNVFIDNIGNPDSLYRLSNLYLGLYTELTRSYDVGDVRRYARRGNRSMMQQGLFMGGILATANEFDLDYRTMPDVDRAALLASWDTTNDVAARKVYPFFFDPDHDEDEALLCEWSEMTEIATSGRYRSHFDAPLKLIELPRSVLTL